MGFSGKLLISACHQLPATSSTGGSTFFIQKEGEGSLKQFAVLSAAL